MGHHPFNPEHLALTRRDFLCRCGMGMGAVSLARLMGGIESLNSPKDNEAYTPPLAPKHAHSPGKARRVIHIFANGGPSHVDTFDPKPSLGKYAGKELPKNLRTQRKTGAHYPPLVKFQ